MPARSYPCTWSRGLLWTTLWTTALLAGLGLFLASRLPRHGAAGQGGLLFGLTVLALTFLSSAALSPRACEVDGEGVAIRRVLGRIRIEREELREIEILDAGAFEGILRTFGVGGLFGYLGRFRLARHGPCRLHATRLDRGVALHTTRGLVVVTPDDAARFAADAAGILGQARADRPTAVKGTGGAP